jgi:hypothetical protein
VRVTVTKVNDSRLGSILVEFSCAHGSAAGEWFGEIPTPGEQYDCEVDIPDALVLGRNLFRSESSGARIENDGEMIRLRGLLVGHIGALVILKLGEDEIVGELEGGEADLPSSAELLIPRLWLSDSNF